MGSAEGALEVEPDAFVESARAVEGHDEIVRRSEYAVDVQVERLHPEIAGRVVIRPSDANPSDARLQRCVEVV